ncbi:glycine, alanine and asparagine-rich protein-like [Schistocerca gregaria]|uniref:glycine, alanine and asparagine-rich protein-like n=1 Tax=Schistocerca gregaria TaxID=7010 RepID=UPI00211F2E3F|nr:glycine, alanine and asparagine-rich protein-like [Schistocerca gregaria]
MTSCERQGNFPVKPGSGRTDGTGRSMEGDAEVVGDCSTVTASMSRGEATCGVGGNGVAGGQRSIQCGRYGALQTPARARSQSERGSSGNPADSGSGGCGRTDRTPCRAGSEQRGARRPDTNETRAGRLSVVSRSAAPAPRHVARCSLAGQSRGEAREGATLRARAAPVGKLRRACSPLTAQRPLRVCGGCGCGRADGRLAGTGAAARREKLTPPCQRAIETRQLQLGREIKAAVASQPGARKKATRFRQYSSGNGGSSGGGGGGGGGRQGPWCGEQRRNNFAEHGPPRDLLRCRVTSRCAERDKAEGTAIRQQ